MTAKVWSKHYFIFEQRLQLQQHHKFCFKCILWWFYSLEKKNYITDSIHKCLLIGKGQRCPFKFFKTIHRYVKCIMIIIQNVTQINLPFLKFNCALLLSKGVEPRTFRMFSPTSGNSGIYVRSYKVVKSPQAYVTQQITVTQNTIRKSTMYLLPTLPNVQQRTSGQPDLHHLFCTQNNV